MMPRLMSLLLLALFGLRSADGASRRAIERDPLARTISAVEAPAQPAVRSNDVGQQLRALAKLPDRHAAPHEVPLAISCFRLASERRIGESPRRELQTAHSSRELSFPYDATAPPGRV